MEEKLSSQHGAIKSANFFGSAQLPRRVACLGGAVERETWHQERKKNWKKAVNLLAGRKFLRPITYPALPITEIQDRIARAGGRVMVVSAHYSLYFLLLTLPATLGLNFVVFVSRNTINFWNEHRRWLPPNVELVDTFSLDYIRAARAYCFFVMADIHDPNSFNAFVPFHGHTAMLTMAWARLAKMLRLDIIPAIAHYRRGRLELMLDYVAQNDSTPYHLVADTVKRLDDFMARDISLWENRDWISMFPKLQPSYTTTEAKSELISLAACDFDMTKALAALMRNQSGW